MLLEREGLSGVPLFVAGLCVVPFLIPLVEEQRQSATSRRIARRRPPRTAMLSISTRGPLRTQAAIPPGRSGLTIWPNTLKN